jgi:iron complex transport system ATP-binding protein
MNAAPLLTSRLTVGYRTRRSVSALLEGLDLRVERGEVVCFIGPNGIGKSTLLRTLAAMQPPLSGRVEIGGCDVSRASRLDLARRLGVVLTDRPPVGSLAARRVVELGRYPHSGWSGALGPRDRRAVDWALDACGAAHLAGREYGRLSDGERQRIMIARALAQEPAVLLLDEPTAFLDAPSRIDVMALLRRLSRDRGLAILMSTHEVELAVRTADRIWLATPDRRLLTGPPASVVGTGDDVFAKVVSLLRPADRPAMEAQR